MPLWNMRCSEPGHLGGIDGDESKTASLKCIDFATGTEKWKAADVGFCSLMAADGKLIIAKASAAKFEPISRTPLLTSRCWSVPVLANGRIYVRNAAGEVVCASVK